MLNLISDYRLYLARLIWRIPPVQGLAVLYLHAITTNGWSVRFDFCDEVPRGPVQSRSYPTLLTGRRPGNLRYHILQHEKTATTKYAAW